jgi:hypothetical protein
MAQQRVQAQNAPVTAPEIRVHQVRMTGEAGNDDTGGLERLTHLVAAFGDNLSWLLKNQAGEARRELNAA